MAIGGELIGAAYIKVHADSSAVGPEIRRDITKAAGSAGDDAGHSFGKGFDKSQKEELRKTVNSTKQQLRFAGKSFESDGNDWGSRLGRSMRTSLGKEFSQIGTSLRASVRKANPFAGGDSMWVPESERAGHKAGDAGGTSFAKGFGNALKNALGPNVNLPFTRAKIPLAALASAIDPVITALGSLGGAAMSLVGPLVSASSVAAAAAPIFASLGVAGATTVVAFSGMGAAIKAQRKIWTDLSQGIKPTEADLKNLDKAMKALTPSAQGMVKAVVELFPELTKIRQVVQENFFAGLAGQFSDLAKTALPQISKGLSDTANSINSVAKSWMSMFKQIASQGTLTAIFAGAQPIITDLGGAMGVLVRAVLEFTQAAMPLAQGLTAEFSKWASSLGQDITAGLQSGKIQAFLTQAKADFDAVWRVVKNVGEALKTTFAIGTDTGRGFIGALGQISEKWNAWTKTTEGQNSIQKFFDSSKQAIDAFMPVVGALAKALADMFNAPAAQANFAVLAKGIADLLPVVGQLLSAISRMGIVSIIGQAMTALGEALAPIMPIVAQLADTIGFALQGAFTALAPLLPPLASALGQILLAITPLVGALGGALTPLISALVQAIVPLLPVVAQIAIALGDVLVAAVQALTPLIAALTPLFVWLFQNIGPVTGGLKGIADLMTNVLVPAITTVIGWIGNVIGWFVNWQRTLSQIQAAASAVFASISSTVANWAQNVGGWLTTVVGWFNSFGSRIADGIRGVGDAIAKPFLSAYDKIAGFISSVVSLFAGFGGRVLSAVSSMGGQILEKLLGGLPGPVRSALGFARGGIVLGPVTAHIGESGAEAIVPLNRPLSQVDPSVRLLSAIAQGKMPGFAKGGVVTNAGRTITVAPGAIVVQTQVENPRRVAEAVLDRMILALV